MIVVMKIHYNSYNRLIIIFGIYLDLHNKLKYAKQNLKQFLSNKNRNFNRSRIILYFIFISQGRRK